jgi:hypothetical protein
MSKTATATKSKGTSATLASMVKPAAAVAAAAVAPEPFDWDSLPEATVAVYTRNTVARKDLEESTPAFIKRQVVSGFDKTARAGLTSRGLPKPVFMTLDCGSAEKAEEFVKLARAYAGFKDYTLRGKANPDKLVVEDAAGNKSTVDGTGFVRFAVKVREVRKAKAA